MKPTPTLICSALVGAALALLSMATARAQSPSGGDPIFHHPGPSPEVRVAGIHDPRDAVRLSGTFTVPDRKVLIMTALGSIQGGHASVDIFNFWPNGTPETLSVNTTASAPIESFPAPGIVVPSGAQLNGGIVYGYLVDAPDTMGKVRHTDPQEHAVRIVGLPGDPREFVYIRMSPADPNNSYTVPAGMRLIVTGIGSSHDCIWASVREYGTTLLYVEIAPGSLFYQVPAPGIPINSERVANPVAVSSANPFPGRVIGYLIDA